MKNRNIRGACLVIVLFALGAAAQQSASPPKASEDRSSPVAAAATSPATPESTSDQKVVLKIGSAQVTEAEINALVSRLDNKAKAVIGTKGLRPVGDEYVRILLLSQRALEQHLDQAPNVRMELQLQRDQILAQAEYQRIVTEAPITEEEISQYYAAHRTDFETVTVREFSVQKRPAPGQNFGSANGLPAAEAKAKAEAARKALLAGKDVDDVAEKFPLSSGVVLIDRKPRTLRRADMKPALAEACFDTPDGGVSEVVDTTQAFFVVKVLAHQRPELKDVSSEVRTKLQRQKLDAEVEAMKKKAGVWMDEEYFKSPEESTSALATQQPSQPQSQP